MIVSGKTNAVASAAARSGGGKKAWVRPAIRVISAGDAENSANPVGSDGVLSMGS